MARFVGKEADVGRDLATRLLGFFVLVLVLLILLAIWHPLFAHDFLATLGLWDLVDRLGK
ncbi:MAG TPA: hypothetical protein VKY74_09420 [Chloroflexia bacterium]|nr:hypothetical protein [Chloroflexia bacterium]